MVMEKKTVGHVIARKLAAGDIAGANKTANAFFTRDYTAEEREAVLMAMADLDLATRRKVTFDIVEIARLVYTDYLEVL